MDQITAMNIYVRVAELSSFSKAAESLGLPKASVSNAVQQLERQFGVRLLHRTTRRVQMTQDGQTCFERCRDLLCDLDELHALFASDAQALTGRVRIDMPVGIARSLVIPRLPELLERHPQLEVELSCTDRRVDLVEEGFDCVVRAGPLHDASLIAQPLGQMPLLHCASPAYLKRHGRPRRLEDLAHHKLVRYAQRFGQTGNGFEYLAGKTSTVQQLEMAATVCVNNADAMVASCLAGLGIMQAPAYAMRPLIVKGLLEEVLPQVRAPALPVSLVYASRRQLPRRTREVMTWLTDVLTPAFGPV